MRSERWRKGVIITSARQGGRGTPAGSLAAPLRSFLAAFVLVALPLVAPGSAALAAFRSAPPVASSPVEHLGSGHRPQDVGLRIAEGSASIAVELETRAGNVLRVEPKHAGRPTPLAGQHTTLRALAGDAQRRRAPLSRGTLTPHRSTAPPTV